MSFKLNVETENAAFDGNDRYAELGRILRDAAEKVEFGAEHCVLRDVNGNIVGGYSIGRK